MKSKLLALPVIALIALGALADHVLSNGLNHPAAVSAATPAKASVQSSATLSSIDAATEHAYGVVSASVVYVLSPGVGSGSGVVYDSTGDIVTNNHVVEGATKLRVTLNDGRTFAATVVGTDKADDLAVIRIHASGLTPAHFASAGSYAVAQTVLAVGSPLGLKQSVTSGLISGLHRVEQEPNGSYLPDAIQTSAPINPGNSGGALAGLDGRVVGIPTLEQTGSQSGSSAQAIGFAVPSERVVSAANQIIATGKVTHTGRAYLGIAPTDQLSQSSSPFGIGGYGPSQGTPTASGAVVSQVAPNGPSAQAGVQLNDVITAVDGTTISSAQDLLTALATKKPGDTVTLTIDRGGATVSVQVHLGEMPA